MFRLVVITVSFILSGPCEARAAEGELWQNIKSPFSTKARSTLLWGTAITLGLLVFEDQIVDPAQDETVENRPLGGLSKFGDHLGQIYPNAAYTIGMLGYGIAADESRALRDASLMVQATLYSSIATTALKYTIREPRPNNGNRKNSFPSGHSTTIFAFASYIGCRHSLPWGIAAYSLAGFVAFSRMNDNAHYIHDITGGATIGAAYGIGVCMAENERTRDKPHTDTIGYLIPIEDGIGAGLKHSF